MRAIGGRYGRAVFVLAGLALSVPATRALAAEAGKAAATTGAAVAGSTPGGSPAGATQVWQFEVVPYAWFLGLDGDTKVGRLPATGVEAGFPDLFHVLDAVFLTTFTAHKDRGGLYFDSMYFDLSKTEPTPEAVFGDARVDLGQQIYSLAGTWRVSGGRAPVTLYGGARYVGLDTDLELTSGVAAGRSVSSSESWSDGYVGASIRWKFAEHWALVGYGDIGAGGSRLTWQGLAGVDWTFSKHLSGKFGYRYFKIDYDQDDFVYDMAMAGGYAGLGIRF